MTFVTANSTLSNKIISFLFLNVLTFKCYLNMAYINLYTVIIVTSAEFTPVLIHFVSKFSLEATSEVKYKTQLK